MSYAGVETAGPDVAEIHAPVDGVSPPMHQGGRGGIFLDEVVVELGFADRKTVDWAVEQSRVVERPVGDVLVGGGILSEDQLARVVAELHGLEHIDLSAFDVDLDVARLVSRQAARRYKAVPVAFAPDGSLMLALADPVDPLAVSDIAVMTRSEVRPMVASASKIAEVVEHLDDAVTRPLEIYGSAEAEPAGEPDRPPSESHLEELAAERDELRKVVERLAEELDAVRAEVETRTQELDAVRAEVETRTQELDAVRAEVEAPTEELDALRGTVEARTAERDALRLQVEERAAERDELQRERAEIDRERQRLDRRREDLDRTREELDRERTKADREPDGLADQRAGRSAPEQRDSGRKELGSLELALGAELARALDENERLEQRIVTVLASAAEIKAARSKLARLG